MSRVPWRRIVIEQLQLLASEAEQLEYEASVAHVDITKELVSGWFDDTYHPRADDFAINFTDDELLALDQFSKAFNQQVVELPPSQGTVKSWHASPHWNAVISGAQSALVALARPSTAGSQMPSRWNAWHDTTHCQIHTVQSGRVSFRRSKKQ